MPPALQNPLTLWLLLSAALAGLAYAFVRQDLRWRAIVYACPMAENGHHVTIWSDYI